MRDCLRLLSLAAAINLTASISAADAQTLVVRNAPPETSVELVMNTDAAGSAKVGASGIGLVVAEPSAAVKADTDAQIFVDVCDKLWRVAIVRRGLQPAAQETGCVRRDMGGVFLIKPITTLVVDVGGPSPTLLLRQGQVSLDPPRTWSSAPTGLILSAGGGFTQIGSVKALACGSQTECSGQDSGGGFAAGATFWITPYVGGEASYMRPTKVTVQGTADGRAGEFRFNSTFGADVLTMVGKLGGPAGRTRLYGLVGATYQQSTFDTSETLTDAAQPVTQTNRLKTRGWGWMFGGGIEIWLAPALAIYGEGGRAWLRGTATEDSEGETDAWMSFIYGGVRVRIGG
jgi:hypothetical protein